MQRVWGSFYKNALYEFTVITVIIIIIIGEFALYKIYLAYYHCRLITKLALSKAHTFAKTADSAKLLLLNKLVKNHTHCCGI